MVEPFEITDETLERFESAYESTPGTHFERTRVALAEVARVGAVQALRSAADLVERDGGTVLTALWASDTIRERADELERGSDRG